jgi:type VI secretion system VgrG family protein
MSGEVDVVIVRLENPHGIDEHLRVLRVRGREHISQLFAFEVVAEASEPGAVIESDVLNQAADLVFETREGEELHRIHGMIAEMGDLVEAHAQVPRLTFRVVPRAHVATQYETLDVFLDQSVPVIVEAVLARSGLGAVDFDIDDLVSRGQVEGDDYPPREFVVQYRESNLAFISRLCEHVGIFYFFDVDGKMVFGDANSTFTELTRLSEVPFAHTSAAMEQIDRVMSLDVHTRNLPARYVVRDYNWRTPGVDLLGQADVHPEGVGQIVEYGGHFRSADEGNWLASVRAQELLARRQVFSGTSTCPSFFAGGTFMLLGHALGDQELLLTEVVHDYRAPGEASGGRSTYRNQFRSILKNTPYRPARITPKPKVTGVLTGIVQGGSGTDFGEVDDHGRYRVRFMFDTAERGETQASRAVRMAQPSAGSNQGFTFPLRANTEVILTCVDGDPDRPIITGAVPNPQTQTPVGAANRHKNIIRTAQNQIDIDDKEPRIKLSAGAFDTQIQLGSPNEPNEGYHLKTANDAVSSAGKAIAAGSKLVNFSSEAFASMANKNVIAVAGPPDPLSGWGEAIKFGLAAADLTNSLLDAGTSVMDFKESQRKNAVEQADAAVKAAEDGVLASAHGGAEKVPKYDPKAAKKTVTADDGSTVTVTESKDEFRARQVTEATDTLDQRSNYQCSEGDEGGSNDTWAPVEELNKATQQQASAKAELEGYQKRTEDLKKIAARIKAVNELGKGVHDQVKAAGKLWGDMHRHLEAATKLKELVTTEAYYAKALAVEYGRKNHRPAIALEPINVQGSTHTTCVYGDNSLILASANSTLYGTNVGVHGLAKATMNSMTMTEMAAPFVYVTAEKAFDLKSDGTMRHWSAKGSYFEATDKMTFVAKKKYAVTSQEDEIAFDSKKKFSIKSAAELEAEATKWKLEAKESTFEVKVKTDYKVTADTSMQLLAANKTEVKGDGTELVVRHKGGYGLKAKQGEAKLYAGSNTSLKLSDAAADLKVGGSKVALGASGVDVKGTSVKLG